MSDLYFFSIFIKFSGSFQNYDKSIPGKAKGQVQLFPYILETDDLDLQYEFETIFELLSLLHTFTKLKFGIRKNNFGES